MSTGRHPLWLGDQPLAEFMQSTWRRKPVLMRGAAPKTVPGVLTRARFFEAAKSIESQRPDRVARSAAGTVFVQELDGAHDDLRGIAAAFEAQTTCDRVWFDGVFAVAGSGIGSHFDASDNFVIQQAGHKHWRLHDPSVIPAAEIRDRMLGTAGVGTIPMPATSLEFDLAPGDVLYIPALWPHWGVSEGDSLSISLVFNAQSALDLLLKRLRAALIGRPAFWHLAEVQLRPDVDGWPAVADELAPALASHLPIDHLVEPAMDVMPEAPQSPPSPEDLLAPTHLPLPRADLQRLFGERLPTLDAAACLFPDEATGCLLRASTGRVYLKRLLKLAQASYPQVGDVAVNASIATSVERLLSMDAPRVWNATLRPEVTCWIHVMHRALDAGYVPRIRELASVLPRLLAGSLIAADALVDGDRLRLELAQPGTVRLEPVRGVARLTAANATQVWLTAQSIAGELSYTFDPGNGKPTTISASELQAIDRPDGPWSAGTRIEPGGLALVCGDAWIEAHYPRGAEARAEPLWTDLGRADQDRLALGLSDGMALLRRRAPAAFDEVVRTLDVLMPVRGHGLDPLNESVHAMRGLVAISARPDYLAAQSLVHETAHNRLSSLLDVHQLVLNPDRERYHSPFTGSDRPVVNLLHGVFSFVQEVALNPALVGHVHEHPGHELADYTAVLAGRIDDALSTIRRHGVLTEAGHALVDRVADALDEGRRQLPHASVSLAVGAHA